VFFLRPSLSDFALEISRPPPTKNIEENLYWTEIIIFGKAALEIMLSKSHFTRMLTMTHFQVSAFMLAARRWALLEIVNG
jgi:hypothetical protein